MQILLLVQLRMRHISCWNVPYNKPIRDKFPSQFENVILGSLKSFFQLEHQVDICLTKATALYHSKQLVCLEPS